MRPRPDAAENGEAGEREPGPGPASMRPRPDAAENPYQARWVRDAAALLQ